MYLLNYDLYDLYALFVYLRNHPERFSQYREGIRQIAEIVASPEEQCAGTNCIRRALRPCYQAEDTYMDFVLTDNVYTAEILIIDKPACYPLLTAMLRELLDHGDDPARLTWLCDAMHNIPVILVRESRPRTHIHFEIHHYQRKYNPLFLKQELRALR